MLRVVLAKADDWEGLYVGDDLVFQTHRIQIFHLQQYCPFLIIGHLIIECVDDFESVVRSLEDSGSFPITYQELHGLVVSNQTASHEPE